MKTKILSMVLIAVLAISTTVMAQSQEQRKRDPEQREIMMKRQKAMKEKHQNFFTEEQKAKMKELRLKTAKQIKPLKNQLNELNAKQQTLTTANDADLKAINKNIDKMSEIKADIAKIMAAQHQNVRSMLNDEQLVKFDAMKNKRGDRKGGSEEHKMKRPNRENLRRG